MRSDSSGPLRDILRHAEFAQQFVADCDVSSFARDMRTLLAVTRCLEIVSEASRRLPPVLKGRHPHIVWARIAGAGNVYRHDYEDLSPAILWDTVQNELPALMLVVKTELRDLGIAP